MSQKKIFLQPHLPPGWSEWKSKKIPLYDEGNIQFEIEKIDNVISFSIYRYGGNNTINMDLEFGLFGKRLLAFDNKLEYRDSTKNLLFVETEIPPATERIKLNYSFKIDESGIEE